MFAQTELFGKRRKDSRKLETSTHTQFLNVTESAGLRPVSAREPATGDGDWLTGRVPAVLCGQASPAIQ